MSDPGKPHAGTSPPGTEPRRILFHHRIRADDGQAVHVRELIAALRGQGHEVLECALVPKGDAAASAVGPQPDRRLTAGLWRRLRTPRLLTELFEIAYSRRGLAMLLKVGRRFKADFIYERHALHCRAGVLAAAHLGVPLLLEVNAPMTDEMSRLGLLRFGGLARRTEAEVLGLADRVLPVSDVLAERLVELGTPWDKVHVIRNAADPARYGESAAAEGRALRASLGLAEDAFIAGFVGYMRAWHRLDLALSALQQHPGMHLVLAGTGPGLEPLVQQARSLGLQPRLHVLGEVSRERLPGVCRAFDVALVPAINEYASPLKVFDSLAAGVATVAPDQPNVREIVTDGETAVLFPTGDARGLAGVLASLAMISVI